MTFAFRILVAATSLLAVQPQPTPDPQRDVQRIETLVFRTGISEFVRISGSHSLEDSRFDWTTDGCSAPVIGDSGRSFDFSRPCLRHDFAYRNYKSLDARSSRPGTYWNAELRQRIDQKFKQDMVYECHLRRASERFRCRVWAETYYKAVRIAGGP